MENTFQTRIRTAEIIALLFLTFFLLMCVMEFAFRAYVHLAFILCCGVLFFSSAAVFGISEENLSWSVADWSKTMKVFMVLFMTFLVVITMNLVSMTKARGSLNSNPLKVIKARL